MRSAIALFGIALSLDAQPLANRAPLAPNAFDMLPLGVVKPKGWLLRQLRVQADGQTGHLDEFWPSLSAKDSAWRGGTGEDGSAGLTISMAWFPPPTCSRIPG